MKKEFTPWQRMASTHPHDVDTAAGRYRIMMPAQRVTGTTPQGFMRRQFMAPYDLWMSASRNIPSMRIRDTKLPDVRVD